jgi:ABC-type amino acid transport substrate-binding protein
MSEMTTATQAEIYEMFGMPVDTFEPFAFYNADGDCVEFFAKGEKYYGERVDDYVTVYRAVETGEIIGSVIKNVRALCAELSAGKPRIKIIVEEGQICIQHLFFLWWMRHANSTPVYQTLTELAVNNHIGEVKLSC